MRIVARDYHRVMVAPELDNPFWFQLRTRCGRIAITAGEVARFPRDHAPFLHVSYDNDHAKALYERLGFRLRLDIPFWSLRRP